MLNCIICNNELKIKPYSSIFYSFYRCKECEFVITVFTDTDKFDYYQFKTQLYTVMVDFANIETNFKINSEKIQYLRLDHVCYFDFSKPINSQIEFYLLLA